MVELPPHARIVSLQCDLDRRTFRIALDTGGEQVVEADRVSSISGCRVAESSILAEVAEYNILAASTWPRELRPHTRVEAAKEELFHFVIGLRVIGLEDLLFLVADSFNFRTALGEDTEYVTEVNLLRLLRRIAILAPRASQDLFVKAFLTRQQPPPAVASLAEFFRKAAR